MKKIYPRFLATCLEVYRTFVFGVLKEFEEKLPLRHQPKDLSRETGRRTHSLLMAAAHDDSRTLE